MPKSPSGTSLQPSTVDWDNKDDPVFLFFRRHPVAGLLRFFFFLKKKKNIEGRYGKMVGSWKLVYFHRASQLFLSVYVDGFKVEGREESFGTNVEETATAH